MTPQSEGLEPSLPSVDPHVLQVWYRTPARVELVGNGSQTRFVPAGHPVPSFFNAHIEGHFMSLCYFLFRHFKCCVNYLNLQRLRFVTIR